MERRNFFGAALLGTAGMMFAPRPKPTTFRLGETVTLPGFSGPLTVTLPARNNPGFTLMPTAVAQAPQFPNWRGSIQVNRVNYEVLVQQQQWIAFQQAQLNWQNQCRAWSQQYQWYNATYVQQTMAVLNQYRTYQQVTALKIHDSTESVYAGAGANNRVQVYFGLNQESKRVEIQHTLPAPAHLWNVITDQRQKLKISKEDLQEVLEETLDPQSNERKMKVKADKGVVIDGGGYDTISGKVFIGDANKDGKNGVLVGATLPSGENKFEFIH